jgi:hypothetical protein
MIDSIVRVHKYVHIDTLRTTRIRVPPLPLFNRMFCEKLLNSESFISEFLMYPVKTISSRRTFDKYNIRYCTVGTDISIVIAVNYK